MVSLNLKAQSPTLQQFYFQSDKSTLNNTQVKSLQKFIHAAPQAATLTIIGNTDTIGKAVHNQVLSASRAEFVAQIILKSRPDLNIKTIGAGESNALSQNLADDRNVSISWNIESTKALEINEIEEIELDSHLLPLKPKNKPICKGNPNYFTDAFETPNGVVVKFNGNNHKIKGIETTFSNKDMIENEMFAFDESGNALITGGMINIEFDTMSSDTISVSMPAEGYDPDMKLYSGVLDANGQIQWKLTDVKINYNETTNAYEFTCGTSSLSERLNIDKPGEVVYTFNLPIKTFENVNISHPNLRFAGLPALKQIVFASEEKQKIKRDVLTLTFETERKKTKTQTLKVRHFKAKKSSRNISYSLKPRFERKYKQQLDIG